MKYSQVSAKVIYVMYIDAIRRALAGVTGLSEDAIYLGACDNLDFGDYFTNCAFLISGGDAQKKAVEIAERLKNGSDILGIVERIEVAGRGFINFWLKREVWADSLRNILLGETFGSRQLPNNGKVAIVEYSSPNVAKPFSIGHLRSTIIGDAIANVLEATGWKVYRDNHLGDWGTQFGKQIYAIKAWGNLDEIERSENPVKELVFLYVKFHEEAEKNPALNDEARLWFKKLEEGDEEARRIWKRCVQISLEEFDRIYKLLGVSFSKEFNEGRGLGESFFEDKMNVVVDELREKGLLKEGEEGAKMVFFDNDKLPPAMILKKDGSTLYHTRDLAADKYRKEKYNPDLIINEVGVEQTLYFQQLFEMERLLGWFSEGQRVHIAHGLYKIGDKKMSTRKGQIIWLEDVIEEAFERVRNIRKAKNSPSYDASFDRRKLSSEAGIPSEGGANPVVSDGNEDDDVSRIIAIGAIKYNDLKRDPAGDIVFDWDEVLNMEGNSGPYLQYTFTRCKSILSKFISQKLLANDKKDNIEESLASEIKNLVYKFNDEESKIARMLMRFPEVVLESANKYAPNIVCNYLYGVAQRYNSFYDSHRIIGGEDEKEGLAITVATARIIKEGLALLGIEVPDRM